MDIRAERAVIAGIIGTALMTAVGVWIGPLMNMPRMNPAEMLAGAMGGNLLLGWIAHFMIGTMLALTYAWAAPLLPGPSLARGALFGLAPFLVAQILVMPLMGLPVFSGSVIMALGSLVGHLIYGAGVTAVYGPVPAGGAAGIAQRHSSAVA